MAEVTDDLFFEFFGPASPNTFFGLGVGTQENYLGVDTEFLTPRIQSFSGKLNLVRTGEKPENYVVGNTQVLWSGINRECGDVHLSETIATVMVKTKSTKAVPPGDGFFTAGDDPSPGDTRYKKIELSSTGGWRGEDDEIQYKFEYQGVAEYTWTAADGWGLTTDTRQTRTVYRAGPDYNGTDPIPPPTPWVSSSIRIPIPGFVGTIVSLPVTRSEMDGYTETLLDYIIANDSTTGSRSVGRISHRRFAINSESTTSQNITGNPDYEGSGFLRAFIYRVFFVGLFEGQYRYSFRVSDGDGNFIQTEEVTASLDRFGETWSGEFRIDVPRGETYVICGTDGLASGIQPAAIEKLS